MKHGGLLLTARRRAALMFHAVQLRDVEHSQFPAAAEICVGSQIFTACTNTAVHVKPVADSAGEGRDMKPLNKNIST